MHRTIGALKAPILFLPSLFEAARELDAIDPPLALRPVSFSGDGAELDIVRLIKAIDGERVAGLLRLATQAGNDATTEAATFRAYRRRVRSNRI